VRTATIHGQGNEIIGSVQVFSDDTQRVQMLDRLREMEQAALIDGLTGLPNRRYFDRAINASMEAYARHDEEFGVLLIDVDHFKQFNDTYGHAVGDKVLQLIARTLMHNCRAYDTPVRWGGEEFVLIADRVTAETLLAAAQRMRMLIAQSALRHEGEEFRTTVSIGCSLVQTGDNVDAVMRRADERLYESKNGGRNRVTM